MNAFGNDVHLKRQGFHPYVWEIANMVRQGAMTTEEGYNKIYVDYEQKLINEAKEKLES